MTPIVLVHGFLGGSAQWGRLADDLSQLTDVIAVDLPGFGANAHLPPIDRIGGFADWVIDQLTQRGIQRYTLLGHSMGGMIAQEIARRDGDRVQRLILYATGANGVLPGRFETIAESKKRAAADGPLTTARRISATWFLEGEAAAGFDPCAEVAECASLEAMLAGLDAMQAWSGEDALSSIEQDTLIIWGDRDRTYSWDQIHQLWSTIPRSSLSVIPGCAHAVHAEKPTLFTPAITDFLQGPGTDQRRR